MTKSEIIKEFSKKGNEILEIEMTYHDNNHGVTTLLCGYILYVAEINGVKLQFEIDDIHSLIEDLIASDWIGIKSLRKLV